MGFISKLIREQRLASLVSLRNPPDWYVQMVGGGATTSGQLVNEVTALSLSAVWACVNIISDTIAMMPLNVNKHLEPKGNEKAPKHPIYKLLHDMPNREQTSFQWRKMMNVHRLLYGAGISRIEFDRTGTPIGLWPIPVWKVTPKRTSNNSLYYEYIDNGKETLLQPWEVVVFTTLQLTDKWMSPIAVHRETIGAAMAVNDYGAKTFGSGINPSGILSGVSFADEDSEGSLRKKYKDCYSGMNGFSNLMILEDGVKFERIGLPPEDAQYLETRRFNISEIARIYGVPLYMLADHEKQTSWGTGIEEQKDGYITFTILPICTQEEQEYNTKLIKDDNFFTEHKTAGLLRGTLKSRMDAYQKGFAMSLYNPDDLRELENLNPIPEGKGQNFFVPMNMETIDNNIEKITEGNSQMVNDNSNSQGGNDALPE